MSAHKQKISAHKAATQRYTIELSPEYQQAISELMDATGLRTQKDLFEDAIALFAWATREVARGRSITSLNEQTMSYAELQMPVLMATARRAAKMREAEAAAAD